MKCISWYTIYVFYLTWEGSVFSIWNFVLSVYLLSILFRTASLMLCVLYVVEKQTRFVMQLKCLARTSCLLPPQWPLDSSLIGKSVCLCFRNQALQLLVRPWSVSKTTILNWTDSPDLLLRRESGNSNSLSNALTRCSSISRGD